MFGPCCQQQVAVYAGKSSGKEQLLGKAIQPICGGCFSPAINMNNQSDNTFAKIKGPTCCFGGCTALCCDQTFKLSNVEETDLDLGKITKCKPRSLKGMVAELSGDADVFTMSFPLRMSVEEKATALGALLLLDYMFFETGKPWECIGCCPCQEGFYFTCTCCYMYCCGAVLPFKCCFGAKKPE